MQLTEAMQNQKVQSTVTADSLLQLLNASRADNENLRINLAERKGENNMLLLMQDKYQTKIDQLEAEIESMSTQSQSSQQNLSTQLKEKNAEIKMLNDVLIAIDQLLEGNIKSLGNLAGELRQELQSYDVKNYAIETRQDLVRVIMYEDFIFRSKSTTRLQSAAPDVLERIAKVIQLYPGMRITIVGHTDNSTPPSSYKNNWIYSVLRAATLANILIEDYDISSNRLIAAGRGAFEPRASNESAEGRKENRRIEFLLKPWREDLVRAIRKEFK